MSQKAKIINKYKTLKYFDQNLIPFKDKVAALTEKDEKEGLKLLRELKLVNYYITMHWYSNLHINSPILPAEFKFKIINGKSEFVEMPTINKKFPSMSEENFNLYLDIYKTLQNVTK